MSGDSALDLLLANAWSRFGDRHDLVLVRYSGRGSFTQILDVIELESEEAVIGGLVGVEPRDDADGVVATWHGLSDDGAPISYLAHLDRDGQFSSYGAHAHEDLAVLPHRPHFGPPMRAAMAGVLTGEARFGYHALEMPLEWMLRKGLDLVAHFLLPEGPGVVMPEGLWTPDLVDEVLCIELTRALVVIGDGMGLCLSSQLSEPEAMPDGFDIEHAWQELRTHTSVLEGLTWDALSIEVLADAFDYTRAEAEWWGPAAIGGLETLAYPWIPEIAGRLQQAAVPDILQWIDERIRPLGEALLAPIRRTWSLYDVSE